VETGANISIKNRSKWQLFKCDLNIQVNYVTGVTGKLLIHHWWAYYFNKKIFLKRATPLLQ